MHQRRDASRNGRASPAHGDPFLQGQYSVDLFDKMLPWIMINRSLAERQKCVRHGGNVADRTDKRIDDKQHTSKISPLAIGKKGCRWPLCDAHEKKDVHEILWSKTVH